MSFQEKDVAKARAALLSRAQKMLHRGGADLEAAGANTASKLYVLSGDYGTRKKWIALEHCELYCNVL